MAVAPAAVTDMSSKKKKKSIFGAIFHRKKNKKKEKKYAAAYSDNDVTSDPTQLHYVPVAQSLYDLSASPAPTLTNHDSQPVHVADDVTAVRANGVSAACSRSSSRSSGFDEISSAVTEWSLLPVTVAHAPNDRPEMTSSETTDDDDKHVEESCENGSTTKKDDYDAGSLDTVRLAVDNRENDNDTDDKIDSEPQPQQAAGDDQQDSCSSQGKQKTDADVKMEELSEQIKSMSERFNELFARVKGGAGGGGGGGDDDGGGNPELRRSTSSLSDHTNTAPRLQQPRSLLKPTISDTGQRSNTAESKYSRNNAYIQWLNAKAGLVPGRDVRLNRACRPITATNDVVMTTDDAPVDQMSTRLALIGQKTRDNVTGVAELNQASMTSAEFDVTSEIHESNNKEAETADVFRMRSTQSAVNWSELQANKARLRRDVCHDLETTFKTDTYDQESPVDESLTLTCPQKNTSRERSEEVDVTQRSGDELNDESSHSGHPSQSQPRSLLAQLDDVFTEDVIMTPTRSVGRSGNPALMPRRLLPVAPCHIQARSTSAQQSDVFDEGEAGSRSLPRDASRTRRLRPAASLDSVPRVMLVRRRSLLEQSADVKGQFARWHQQLSTSRSLSPSGSCTAPLRALPVHSTSPASLSSSSSAAAAAAVARGGGDTETWRGSTTPLRALPEVQQGPSSSSSSPSSSSASTSETVPSTSERLQTVDHHQSQSTSGSFEMTSSGSAAGAWSRDDAGTWSLVGGVSRGPGRRLYRSDSLPAGGSDEAVRARARVAIPRTAMARFNADGTPKSILKKTVSLSNDDLSH